jgi:hypothetical protein
MKRNLLDWALFAALTTSTAIVTASLLNISAAFAADIYADRFHVDPGLVKKPGYESPTTADIVGKPSIHDMVMNELTRGEPADSHVRIENRDSLPATRDESAAGKVPTSMLWPAYKCIPQLSGALSG